MNRLRTDEKPEQPLWFSILMFLVVMGVIWWSIMPRTPDSRVTVHLEARQFEDLLRQQVEATKQMGRQLDSIRLRLEALERKR